MAEHVSDVGLRDAEDDQLWNYADSNGAAIFTKDEDFSARKMLQRGGPAVVWLRVGNCSKADLLRWFQPLLPDVLGRLAAGEEVIEIV